MKILQKSRKLATLLSLPALDGHVFLLAGSGLLTPSLAPLYAFTLMVGPASLVTAMEVRGDMKEIIMTVLMAGIIATTAILIAAVIGSKATQILNFKILKIIGGLAIITIGLTIVGLKIPDKIPLILMVCGIVVSVILR